MVDVAHDGHNWGARLERFWRIRLLDKLFFEGRNHLVPVLRGNDRRRVQVDALVDAGHSTRVVHAQASR